MVLSTEFRGLADETRVRSLGLVVGRLVGGRMEWRSYPVRFVGHNLCLERGGHGQQG
jgi:hypothetical protein